MKHYRIFDEIVNEHGFDPFAPGPEMSEFEPWSARGMIEALAGRTLQWTPDQVVTQELARANLKLDQTLVQRRYNPFEILDEQQTIVLDTGGE